MISQLTILVTNAFPVDGNIDYLSTEWEACTRKYLPEAFVQNEQSYLLYGFIYYLMNLLYGLILSSSL